MELILNSDYKNLGKKGDVVVVKPGYGRNYLIPQGIATTASYGRKKVALENAKQATARNATFKANAEALALRLASVKVVLKVKVGEGGRVFGSVTPLQVAKAIKMHGIEGVEYSQITIDHPIKVVGSYQATLALHEKVACILNFDVISA